jgi:lysine 2,3-aminomutase
MRIWIVLFPVLLTAILTGSYSRSVLPVPCTVGIVPAKEKSAMKVIPDNDVLLQGIDYIRRTPAIRDVLLSGGDPFFLTDDKIDWLLTELKIIPHVEVVRIGTRIPVVLPYRVTAELVSVLKKHHPLWVNTHFNHPKEITESSKEALRRLADAGIPLGNQTVLLAGINDSPIIIKKLVHKLVKTGFAPITFTNAIYPKA